VLCEAVFYILRHWTVDDFCKTLFADMSECNLSAMVEATGDNAAVMENGNVRVYSAARANNDFAVRSFDVASIDALLRMTQAQ
jgi:hypothetical protein